MPIIPTGAIRNPANQYNQAYQQKRNTNYQGGSQFRPMQAGSGGMGASGIGYQDAGGRAMSGGAGHIRPINSIRMEAAGMKDPRGISYEHYWKTPSTLRYDSNNTPGAIQIPQHLRGSKRAQWVQRHQQGQMGPNYRTQFGGGQRPYQGYVEPGQRSYPGQIGQNPTRGGGGGYGGGGGIGYGGGGRGGLAVGGGGGGRADPYAGLEGRMQSQAADAFGRAGQQQREAILQDAARRGIDPQQALAQFNRQQMLDQQGQRRDIAAGVTQMRAGHDLQRDQLAQQMQIARMEAQNRLAVAQLQQRGQDENWGS